QLTELYALLDKYIKSNQNVLDIGFGSGRDLRYIESLGANGYGVDATQGFVDNMLHDPNFKNRVFCIALPNLDIPLTIQFDVITAIAMIMHLTIEELEASLIEIKKYLKSNGIIIISYSTGNRTNDPRFFEKLEYSTIKKLFEKQNFKEIEVIRNYDKLDRDLVWVTGVFQRSITSKLYCNI
ncbi:MAG: class I SAM-dependent methyltransferase, partial [Campylobacterota bacterium]|nr:class I SAM-dependent methyltransferase [Campylobacterota bacterium]